VATIGLRRRDGIATVAAAKRYHRYCLSLRAPPRESNIFNIPY
jgi:hypothetical protein